MLKDRHVLITGGTGSFGKKCTEILLNEFPPKRLVIFSRDEQKHVDMARNGFSPAKFPQIRYFVGDVRDEARLRRAMRGIDFVIHAAAMKHVDIAEYNPQECIRTNIGGAENVINAAIDSGVEKVVALSTDKAAAPVNLYGATKLCSDKLFVAANAISGGRTRFAAVRYGNVVGSNGSVIPFFQKQRHTGELTITSPEMTRFVITLDQGVRFVLDAFKRMVGGEIFVPKIPSVTINDIAEAIAPECKTRIIGIRPGEKLHECMIPSDEARQTIEFEDSFIVQPAVRSWTNEVPAYVAQGRPCPAGFSFSSETNVDWLSVAQLRQMILEHCPTSEQPAPVAIHRVAA
ncbi:MAG: UDP-N-acetylglucosamine 4,6-dehydratase (inverting) [Planctomycetaceae bacterium]|nr:UDP-N-acetylglucosamine 4,6-dehydratase (inverting) [Planctomycetales bacterium]MCB9921392.1 UDP-N-acetylglucosamine 4,6-dehydratase (inverting) [Planctomycetaceae bacterium]